MFSALCDHWPCLVKPVEKHGKSIEHALEKEYAKYEGVLDIYPPRDMLFNAFRLFPENDLSVVIVGQDPYHQPKQAMGLSFSVPSDVNVPPSLRNIFKELQREYGLERTNPDLSDWASQGVLLLNMGMSVLQGRPMSHYENMAPIHCRCTESYFGLAKECCIYAMGPKYYC